MMKTSTKKWLSLNALYFFLLFVGFGILQIAIVQRSLTWSEVFMSVGMVLVFYFAFEVQRAAKRYSPSN